MSVNSSQSISSTLADPQSLKFLSGGTLKTLKWRDSTNAFFMSVQLLAATPESLKASDVPW
jgi:hypothetical protein